MQTEETVTEDQVVYSSNDAPTEVSERDALRLENVRLKSDLAQSAIERARMFAKDVADQYDDVWTDICEKYGLDRTKDQVNFQTRAIIRVKE